MTSEGFFSTDYFAARSRFCSAARAAGARLVSLGLDARGPGGEELSIDIAWLGDKNPRRVALHSSGLHGVEAFAGSAIQLQFLDNPRPPGPGAALILVHVLNPYGMAWLRRVNENNVDLNRNFLVDGDYSGAPDAYGRVNPFLNPTSPPSWDFFVLKAAGLILKYGMPVLKQAVVGGQYSFPRGLFFGGARLEQGPQKYRDFLFQALAVAERVTAVDVHTGLGKYGSDLLLVPPEEYERCRKVFGDRVTASEPEKSAAYRIRGGLHDMVQQVASPGAAVFVTQEFGTYAPTKVLHALREENRWHHFGSGSTDHPTKQKLLDIFCPPDQKWRSFVLERGGRTLRQAIDYT